MKEVLLFRIAIAVFGCLMVLAAKNNGAFLKKYLEMLAKSDYSTRIPPTSSRGIGKPIDVICDVSMEIFEVDDTNMDFTVKIDFNQVWNDSRLAFPDEGIDFITLTDEKLIWTPNLQFWEEKDRHQSPYVMLNISKSGTVNYFTQLTLVFTCLLDFRSYPHDKPKCEFNIISYEYERDEVELAWDTRHRNLIGEYDPYLLQYQIQKVKGSVAHFTGGTNGWSVLKTELTFQREFAFFVRNLYGPFALLTALTWLSFWIPAKLMAPRLSFLMALMILMLMVHIGFELKANPPKTSYSKGSNVWVAVCESLVFAAFLEFIAVHIAARNSHDKSDSRKDAEVNGALENESKVNAEGNEPPINPVLQIIVRLKRDVLLSSRIDKVCRVLFPAVFIGFNIVYWIVYCTWE